MKISITILFAFLLSVAFSQPGKFDVLLQNGKNVFQKDVEDPDFQKAADYLEEAVKLNPGNAEAHYFLGYAYSRLNAEDGNSMMEMNLPMLLKCSEQFETVNKLTPKYTGQIVVLDPYSKLTGEWGSMAMKYWYQNKTDSAIWAFNEGRKRGGFGDFFLSLNREVLDLCGNHSILISSGDNFTIPLWYLQIVEGYRTDVTIVDISLLNSNWYPRMLMDKKIARFDLPAAAVDSMTYCKWDDSVVTIGTFSWTIKPSYHTYLLRGDRLFLSMLQKENFKREINFTPGFPDESMLSLNKYIQPNILLNKLNLDNSPGINFEMFKSKMTDMLPLVQKINPNSQQELNFIEQYRYILFTEITDLINDKHYKNASELLKLMDTYIDEKKFPYSTEEFKAYAQQLRSKL